MIGILRMMARAGLLEVFFTPIPQIAQRRPQTLGQGCEGVFDLKKGTNGDVANDQLVAFQFTQLPHEHALGNVGHQFSKFVETFGALPEMIQQEAFPPAADHVESQLDWASARFSAVAMIEVRGRCGWSHFRDVDANYRSLATPGGPFTVRK